MTEQDNNQARSGASASELDATMREEYFAAKKILGGQISLVDAAQFWSDNKMLRVAKATSVEKMVAAVLNDIEERGNSLSFFRAARVYYRRFAEDFGKRSIASIKGIEVSDWINAQKLSPSTKFELRSKMSYLFRRAKALEFIDATPIIDKELLPKFKPKKVTVLSVEKMQAFLKGIAKDYPQFLPNFVLRAFAGLRASEAEKMRWEWIDEKKKRFVIPASAGKTGEDWVFEAPMLPDTVFNWLAAIPADQKHGKLPAPALTFMKKFPADVYPLWKKNVMRHTYCAMQISKEQNADKTALLLRHHGSPTTLYKRYAKELVPVAKATEYFKLKP